MLLPASAANSEPRLEGRHPELRARTLVPDVLLQPHNASLAFAFYEGHQFPEEYRGDLFAAEHGSWKPSRRTGYEGASPFRKRPRQRNL